MTDRNHASAGVDMASADTSFARDGAAWSEITALGDNNFRIRLGGLLRPTWMLGVCNGLAQNNVSIDRAHARRLTHDASWIAELHVVALDGASDPLQLPLIAYAESGPASGSAPLALRTYELIESTDHAGTLRLTFNAQDSVGLLGSLLLAFSSLSLLPVEMHIETREKEACDCLWLATSNAGKPSAKDRVALDALLRSTVQH
ncbi:MAG TPA: hypothetical protein VFN67_38060 [Polyangiales bacterium]|jgi:hypothetical protein|nr:hypothetical protein [Polyangiales bacterium]